MQYRLTSTSFALFLFFLFVLVLFCHKNGLRDMQGRKTQRYKRVFVYNKARSKYVNMTFLSLCDSFSAKHRI